MRKIIRLGFYPVFVLSALVGHWLLIRRFPQVHPIMLAGPVLSLLVIIVMAAERLLPYRKRWNQAGPDFCSMQNYGKVLSIWDQIFGTYYLPMDKQVGAVGVVDPYEEAGTAPLLKYVTPILLLLAFISSGARAGIPEDSEAKLKVYESVYPLYAELCSHSQIKKLPGFGLPVLGGEWGHFTLYLKGACRDMSEGYPLIRACDELTGSDDSGVGASVDSDYQSVNWIAVPNRHFFYWGDLKPGERFTRDVYQRTLKRAQAMGLLNGVKAWDKVLAGRPAGFTPEEFLWADVFGTEFAVNIARESSCVRVPLDREMLGKMVEYLNELNRYSRSHDSPYDGVSNNCVHTAHNALAATGFIAPLKVNQPIPLKYLDLALPYNEIVSLVHRGNGMPIEHAYSMWQDEEARKWLLDENHVPTQPGVVIEHWPIYQANDVYDTTTSPKFLEIPGIDSVSRKFSQYTTTLQFTDLDSNLLSYQARLFRIQKDKPSTPMPVLYDWSFVDFFNKYYEWIDAQIVDIGQKLKVLGIN